MFCAADQTRWEKEVEVYEKKHPHYRSYLAQKHVKKLNDKGVIDIQLAQLGIKKPFTARHYYIKEQVEVASPSPLIFIGSFHTWALCTHFMFYICAVTFSCPVDFYAPLTSC